MRHFPLQGGTLRAVADHHQSDAGGAIETGEQIDLLFVREPAHVPDDEFTIRRETITELPVAAIGAEALEVHAPRPAGDPFDTAAFEFRNRVTARSERAPHGGMDTAQ